jgi:hypothetical protein
MSRSKRFLFETHVDDEAAKAVLRVALDARRASLQVRIATRRKNRWHGRRWDPLWPGALATAARELGIDALTVNDGIYVANAAEADRVRVRAEQLWRDRATGLGLKTP